MKTLLHILIILLLGALVAGALYLTIENTSLLSTVTGFPEETAEFGGRPEMPTGEMGERPGADHADHHTASLSRGISGIGSALAKIGIITVIVLMIQAIPTWLRRWIPVTAK